MLRIIPELFFILTTLSLTTACSPSSSSPNDLGPDSTQPDGTDSSPTTPSTGNPSTDNPSTEDDPPAAANSAPTADAGLDQQVNESTLVTLNGAASSDADGSIASFHWEQTGGTSVTLSTVDQASVTFTSPDAPSTLTFQLTVTDDAGVSQQDTVDVTVEYFYQAAPVIATTTYQGVSRRAYNVADDCSSFEPNFVKSDTIAGLKSLNAGSLAVIWGNTGHLSADQQTFFTNLENSSSTEAQNLVANLAEMRRILTEDLKYDFSNNRSPVDGKCYRNSILAWETEIWSGEFNSISGAWVICKYGDKQLPVIAVSVGNLQNLANANTQDQMVTHEYFHVLDCSSGTSGDNDDGWEWGIESMANYVGNRIAKSTVAINQFHENHHMSLSNALKRYGIWPFWQYLSYEMGNDFMLDLVLGETNNIDTLLEYIRRISPNTCASNDSACQQQAFGNLYGRYANSTVNMIPYHTNDGMDLYTGFHQWYETQTRHNATLYKKGESEYQIAPWIAPNRYGHNIIELIRDPDTDILTIGFDGWDVPERESDWRVTVIATLDDTSMPRVEAQGEMFTDGTQTINLAQWEDTLGRDIKRLHLVVAAVPQSWVRDPDLRDFSDATRNIDLDQYMYRLKIKGGWPKGHEPLSVITAPSVSGQLHSNGGGFVADTATVDSTAYVGPEARVLDSAQVLGNARIEGRATVQQNAIVRDNAIVSTYATIDLDAQVRDNATVRDGGRVYRNAIVQNDAKVQGEVFLWDSFSVSDKAMAMGMSMIETTNGTGSLSGTAIMNGEGFFGEGSASQGTSRNDYAVNDNGLLLHYNFEQVHPYRIRDQHGASNAFFFDNSKPGLTGEHLVQNTALGSQVAQFSGNQFMELSKWSLDQTSYDMEWLMNWQVSTNTQTLLSAATDNNELLQIDIVPVSGGYQLKITVRDRDANTLTQTLNSAHLLGGQWVRVNMVYDNSNQSLTLKVTPEGGGSTDSASLTLNYGTRAFHYNSLEILLGCNTQKQQYFTGLIDAFRVSR